MLTVLSKLITLWILRTFLHPGRVKGHLLEIETSRKPGGSDKEEATITKTTTKELERD